MMKAYYCVGTHWDREWYEPFQEFRRWLVELVDELIELMENDPEYRCFHLDGQTVVLADYLEIRPERREQLMKLLRERRLLAGPWYDLPDEWLVSGESFVRNLMRGIADCRALGVEPLDFAYTPDQFGHVAALPMIMRGFGLSAGICWRGTQDETHGAHFAWEGPDGRKLAYHKLMDKGSYANFDFAVRRPLMAANYDLSKLQELFAPFLEDEGGRAPAPLLLMLDAVDHQRPDPHMPAIMAELRRLYPEIEFVWGTLEEYGRELSAHLDALPVHKGELRVPCRDHLRVGQYLIVHTISSRHDLKKRNDQCQALLEKWAEPLLLFENMRGGGRPAGFLGKSWEYLLRNHPHDSICGCSVDQVHRDMHYRFDQSEMLAEGCVRRSMAAIAAASDAPDDWRRIAVHNPLPVRRREVVDLPLYFPSGHGEKSGQWYIDGLAWSERYNKFHLLDANGQRLAYQHVRIERGIECRRLAENGRETVSMGDLYHVAVELDLPPCGHTTVAIAPCDAATRTFGSMLTGPMRAANGLIEFELRPDGTGRLTSLADGRVFENLFVYEDSGEVGDGWTRGQPINDVVFRSPGSRVMTAIEEDGPLRTVFRVDRLFHLPAEIDQKTGWRSAARVELAVTDFITVARHMPGILVKSVVSNTAKDHRMRVLFPSGVSADSSFADSPFALINREITIPSETAEWQERINPEKPFTSFFGVRDDHGGLAVVSPFGCHEYAVLDDMDRTLALTLFRSFRKTVNTPGEKDGQLQGELVFGYLLTPFQGPYNPLPLLNLAGRLQTGVKSHTVSKNAPAEASLVSLERHSAVVTAIKPAGDGDGGVIRFWNPTTEDVSDFLKTAVSVKDAWECDLNEAPIRRIDLENGRIPVNVAAGALLTIRFSW